MITFFTSIEVLRFKTEALVYILAEGNYSNIRMADGSNYTITMQLGQIESRLYELSVAGNGRFIRLGKSLIVNKDFIVHIMTNRQKLVLSDCKTFRYDLNASREALKKLKEYLEQEA